MRSGYKVTLGILTIMILVTITIGTSYSYYSVASTQENPNELTTTCFDVSFSEGSSSINLAATYPMSEASANSLSPYTFTITNTCTTENATDPINYVVTLNTLTANTPTLPLNLLRVRLDETSPSSVTGTSALLSDVPPYTLGESLKTSEGIDTSYNLVEGTLAPGESVTYNLRLWIDESAGKDVMNDSFTGRVLVYSYM